MSCIKIKSIHFELSSHCNAACQLCSRHVTNGNTYHKSSTLIEQDLGADFIAGLLADPLLADCHRWLLCGILGEPMMNPEIADICQLFLDRNSGAPIEIHTNGGIGRVEAWQALGRMLSTQQQNVNFSIDGLEDTNHIYRRNVRWDVIMRNLSAFIESGGYAVWKFIPFDYNLHQIDAAQQMAKDLGCAEFKISGNVAAPKGRSSMLQPRADLIYDPTPMLPAANSDPIDLVALNSSLRLPVALDCEHLGSDQIYIDAAARVWPCCHILSPRMSSDTRQQRLANSWLIDPYGQDWNDLRKHSLSEILAGKYWNDLYSTLVDNSGIYVCSHKCAAKQHKRTVIQLASD